MRVPHAVLRAAARARPELRRGGRLPAPASLKQVTGRVPGATFVMLRPDRCIVAKELYWGGGRRPQPADALAIDVYAALARTAGERAVSFDIGAYTGIFTVIATKMNPDLHAYAFEIVPDVFDAMMENLRANGVDDRVTPELAGLGEPGQKMLVPARSGGSALPDFFSADTHFDSGEEIAFRALDDFVPAVATGARTVMKIDVEGTEDAVLANGQAFLAAHRPDILCELLAGKADAAAVERTLTPHGYSFYVVGERVLEPREHLVPHPMLRDWLFTTRSVEDLRSAGITVSG